jgi:4-amino-4-deoxy-L-arabinose transferase-like glycosyltransferase
VFAYTGGHHGLRIDEDRYVAFARNLTQGYYSPPGRLNLWNGPGYPLVLAPFLALNLPWAAARLLNVVLLYLALLYLFRVLRAYVPARIAYVGVYSVGLMPVVVEHLPRLLTEPLCMFLISGFAYHLCKAHRHGPGWRLHLVIAAVFLGYAALTKVLFGYVIAAAIVILLATFVVVRRRSLLKSLIVACLGLLVCMPYLSYTYSLTGRLFYWANSGGLSLYWMSTPYDREYGDWLVPVKPWLRHTDKGKNHFDLLAELEDQRPLERDDTLKKTAIHNIGSHPGRYARNWGANLGRLFCNYPFSYVDQTPETYWYLIPGVLLAALLGLTAYPAWIMRGRIPHEITALAAVALLYIGGSSLLSAFNRMLMPVLPLLAIWICYVLAVLGRDAYLERGDSSEA